MKILKGSARTLSPLRAVDQLEGPSDSDEEFLRVGVGGVDRSSQLHVEVVEELGPYHRANV